MAAEESGKIVSAGYGLKSYLPAHSAIHKKLHLPMCIFADAIRVGRAEAKDVIVVDYLQLLSMQSAWDALRQSSA